MTAPPLFGRALTEYQLYAVCLGQAGGAGHYGRVRNRTDLHTLLVFLGAYVTTVFAAALIISLDGQSFAVSFSAALTCVSNVGPGLEAIGPSGNFAAFSGLSKGVMSLCMIVGRLEIFPILVLLSPSTWKKT